MPPTKQESPVRNVNLQFKGIIRHLACLTRGDCVIPGGSSALSGTSGFSFQHQLWLPLLLDLAHIATFHLVMALPVALS